MEAERRGSKANGTGPRTVPHKCGETSIANKTNRIVFRRMYTGNLDTDEKNRIVRVRIIVMSARSKRIKDRKDTAAESSAVQRADTFCYQCIRLSVDEELEF